MRNMCLTPKGYEERKWKHHPRLRRLLAHVRLPDDSPPVSSISYSGLERLQDILDVARVVEAKKEDVYKLLTIPVEGDWVQLKSASDQAEQLRNELLGLSGELAHYAERLMHEANMVSQVARG
jgi:hypothetical protein